MGCRCRRCGSRQTRHRDREARCRPNRRRRSTGHRNLLRPRTDLDNFEIARAGLGLAERAKRQVRCDVSQKADADAGADGTACAAVGQVGRRPRVQRRTSRSSVEKGGWSVFHTWWTGASTANPAVSAPLRGQGDKGWFGWFQDAKIEALTQQWLQAPDDQERLRLANAIQAETWDTVPSIPLGQFLSGRRIETIWPACWRGRQPTDGTSGGPGGPNPTEASLRSGESALRERPGHQPRDHRPNPPAGCRGRASIRPPRPDRAASIAPRKPS